MVPSPSSVTVPMLTSSRTPSDSPPVLTDEDNVDAGARAHYHARDASARSI